MSTECSTPRLARDQNPANATVAASALPPRPRPPVPPPVPHCPPFSPSPAPGKPPPWETAGNSIRTREAAGTGVARGRHRVPTTALSSGGHDPSARPWGLNPNALLPLMSSAPWRFTWPAGRSCGFSRKTGWEGRGPGSQGPSILQKQAGAGETPAQAGDRPRWAHTPGALGTSSVSWVSSTSCLR